MSDQIEIVEVEPESGLAQAVIELGNGPAKRTLGLLPNQAFMDRARRGTLLAAVEHDRLLGYLLYDLPRHDVKIVHLCVAPDAQRKGIARRLVEALAQRHRDRRGIVLACRHDYEEASAVWQALDFRPQASRPGRSKEGHMLDLWVLDFGHPTLFDDFEDERPAAALDHNVFLDLHMKVEERPQGEESHYLLSDWIGEYVELCVTDEVFMEIRSHDNPAERRLEQQWATQYRNLSSPNDPWRELTDTVASIAPKAGPADHRHVARAAAAGARYLITRDRDLLNAADAIRAELDLAVLQPAELIVHLDQMRADDPYQPVALQGTELNQLSPSAGMHEEVLTALLNHGAGEKRAELGSCLRPILADRESYDVQVIRAADGRIVAGFARRVTNGDLEIPFIRVAPGQRGLNVIARQLAFSQRKRAADLKLAAARITDPHLPRGIREVLKLEHFEEDEKGWTCRVKTGLLRADEIGVAGPLSLEKAVRYEDAFWPAKVIGAEVPTYIVPIKVPFAEALLDAGFSEQSLLPRQLGLGLDREHVYYRSTQNARGISPGARILWYVTGDAPVHPRGSIRAVSQVADVVTGRPKRLHARFKRFGVYSLKQVSAKADGNGEVMALRFTNTEVLERPLSVDDLETIWDGQGDRFYAPQSPTLIHEHMFALLYTRSSRYVD